MPPPKFLLNPEISFEEMSLCNMPTYISQATASRQSANRDPPSPHLLVEMLGDVFGFFHTKDADMYYRRWWAPSTATFIRHPEFQHPNRERAPLPPPLFFLFISSPSCYSPFRARARACFFSPPSWKLIYSSTCPDGKHSKSSDTLKSIEDISYVSENCRLSHTDTGILRVYKRVSAPPRTAALAAAVASGDDTAQSAAASLAGGGSTARASATAAGRVRRKQPARKRMFFGWRR